MPASISFPRELRYQKTNERKRKKAKTNNISVDDSYSLPGKVSVRIPFFPFTKSYNEKIVKFYSSAEGSLSSAFLSTFSLISPPTSIVT